MNSTFQFRTAQRIFSGPGSLKKISQNIGALGANLTHIAIVTQPSMVKYGYVETLTTMLKEENISSEVFSNVSPEPTIEQVEELSHLFNQEAFDLVIGIGGGSVLDVTKFLAVLYKNEQPLRHLMGMENIEKRNLPMVLIPSTAGTGSEVTPNSIITIPEEELKVGVVSQYFLPDQIYIDPEVTVNLPAHITAATGMDAFTHALESFISTKANVMSDMYAMKGMQLISENIVAAYHDGSNLEAREGMLLGSMFGGMALSAAGTAAVHAMAYPIGGSFGVTHGVANSMLLPHVMRFNFDAIEAQLLTIAKNTQLSSDNIAEGVLADIEHLTKELQIPQDLGSYGVERKDLSKLSNDALNVKRLMDNNPKTMEFNDVEKIYEKLLPK